MLRSQEEEQRKREIKELKDKLKDSLDDKYDIKDFKLDEYRKAMVSQKETQNTVSSIMSAMVSQIAVENSYMQVYDECQDKAKVEEAENLYDLFDELNTELSYAFKFVSRPPYQQ